MSHRFEGFAVDGEDNLAELEGTVHTVTVDPETPVHVVCRSLTRKLPGYGDEAFRLLTSAPHQAWLGKVRWANWGPKRGADAPFAWWAGVTLHGPALAVFRLTD